MSQTFAPFPEHRAPVREANGVLSEEGGRVERKRQGGLNFHRTGALHWSPPAA